MPLDLDASFLPTASLQRLQLRAALLQHLRDVFTADGYWECETPILSRDIVVDANLEPFTTRDADGTTFYLQTSPEAGMKRLLAAGATAIFQVSRVFRRGEVGQRHNPEFTMIEWYRAGDTHFDQMTFVEKLVRAIDSRADELAPQLRANSRSLNASKQPFERLTYDAAFERHAGSRVLGLSNVELRELARREGVDIPESVPVSDRDGVLNLLLADLVEPHLGQTAPQFLIDYPASQAALARIRQDEHPVAERFELYHSGVELCNGYHELTDPDELMARTTMERRHRQSSGANDLPGAPRLEAALRAGIPGCCGVALGFDRLAMLALGAICLADVIAFPRERA